MINGGREESYSEDIDRPIEKSGHQMKGRHLLISRGVDKNQHKNYAILETMNKGLTRL